jgi:cell division protein FtsI (penicillin-binding protein 3)
VQFGARLTPRETFETLRDLGFGTPTGVAIPGEAEGTLRKPAQWQSPSAASLAMGYEISVTPLQLVAAYSALANDGQVIQPHIIREIRDSDGQLLYRARPRPLRRVFSERVAKQVRELLVSVVDSGTAVRADLATFQLAGKSGTARRTSQGKYVEGSYTASFVGLFPAERPQYVVLVKLDSPKRAFFGGEVAAPVSAIVLRAALAAGNAALDREGLASQEKTVSLNGEADSAAQTSIDDAAERAYAGTEAPTMGIDPGPYAERTPSAPKLMSLPFRKAAAVQSTESRPVPDVAGMTTRNAVRALHRAGFRVTLVKSQNGPTVPAKGTVLPPGSMVKLVPID